MSSSNVSSLQVGWPPNYPLGASSSSVAQIQRISRITFATGVLGLLATTSSTTTFAFPGLAANSVLNVNVQGSSLSTALFHPQSFVSQAGVGAIFFHNVASIMTLSPKVWDAVAYTFDA